MEINIPFAEYLFQKGKHTFLKVIAGNLLDAIELVAERVADPKNYYCVKVTKL
jgi:hypothetical protein